MRRCQASKPWNHSGENPVSFHKGKPSILVANAGGGGGGIASAFVELEQAIRHMGGHEWPMDECGIFDYIGVNRWNQEYKREALKSSVANLISKNKVKD
jgi:hypothetical protein